MSDMGVYNPGPQKNKMNIKVIALAVVCIVLAAGLVGVTAIYLAGGNSTDLKAQVAAKDSQISDLQATNANLQSQLSQVSNTNIASYQNQIDSLNAQLSALNETVSGYYNIALLKQSDTLFQLQPVTQDANATTEVFSDEIFYAGYVIVQATASANTTYVEVTYNFGGTDFDSVKVIGASGSVAFPVLPATIHINIGNTNQTAQNSVTASATYYY
jgi:hypothetical protein